MDAAAVLGHVAAWIERHRPRFQGPGIVLGLTDRERTLGTIALGDAAPGEPVGDDHLWQIASVSKSFTAALVMQEAAAGTLSLDDPVTRFLPWFTPENAFAPVTIHHLLTHTAGIATGYDLTGDAIEELLLLRDQEVASPPGSHHVYSNAGYKALGAILEAVAGRRWWELARERILEPLGMRSTEPVLANDMRPRLATGWVPPFDDRPWHPTHGLTQAAWFESYTADGTISSNAADMTAYVRMYLRDGGDVLRSEDVDRMTRGDAHDPETDAMYGYGLWMTERNGHRFCQHTGSLPGYRAMIMFDRERGLGGCVMTNGATFADVRVELLTFAIEAAHTARAGEALPDLPPPSTLATIGADAHVLAGRYVDDRSSITIAAHGDGLTIEDDGRRADLLVIVDGYVTNLDGWDRYAIRFDRDGDAVSALAYGPRTLHPDGVFVLPPPPSDPAWSAVVGRYRAYGIEPMHVEVLERAGRLWLVTSTWEETSELVALGDGRYRVGAEPWMPGRARFEAPIGDGLRRLILDGARFVRVP